MHQVVLIGSMTRAVLTYDVVHARAAHVVVGATGGYVVADVILAEELEEGGVWAVVEVGVTS